MGFPIVTRPAHDWQHQVATTSDLQLSRAVSFFRFDRTTQFADDKLFYQHGRRVYKDVILMTAAFIAEHIASHGLVPGDVARYWLHQANRNMSDRIAGRLLAASGAGDSIGSVVMQRM